MKYLISLSFLIVPFINQAQDKWSPLIHQLDSIEESSLLYPKLLVEIAWQISDLSPDSAIYYANKGLQYAEKYKSDSIRVRALIGLSTAYSIQGKHTESIDLCMEALRKAELIKDTVSIIDAANNIGIDFYYQEDFKNALTYFQKCADISSGFSKGDRKKIIQYAHSIMNVALVEAELGDVESEIKSYQQVIEIFKSIDYVRGYSNALFNLGKTYHGQKKFEDALICYQESAKSFEENEFNSAYSDVLTQWSRLLFELDKNDDALKKLRESLDLSISTNNTLQIQYGYKLAHEIFARKRQFDSAYIYQGKYQELLNEAREKEKVEYAEELSAKYTTEQKEQQISQLEQANVINELEADRQKQIKVFSIVAAVLFGVAMLLVINRNRIKNRTNQLLDAKNKELSDLNTTKDRLFSIISHDLKSPLSSFHTITKSLTDNWENIEKDQMKDFILSLKDSSKEVHDMMDNLLRWALSQTGQLQYKPTSINAESIIEEVKAQLTSPIQANKLKVKSVINSSADIIADNDFLKIVIRNLLSNAIKYSAMETEIEIVAEENESSNIISIRDQGVGIKKEDVSKLFADAGSVHEIKNATNKGTGLGLTLCKELMDKMGATIEVESEVEKGSTFRLIFPKAA